MSKIHKIPAAPRQHSLNSNKHKRQGQYWRYIATVLDREPELETLNSIRTCHGTHPRKVPHSELLLVLAPVIFLPASFREFRERERERERRESERERERRELFVYLFTLLGFKAQLAISFRDQTYCLYPSWSQADAVKGPSCRVEPVLRSPCSPTWRKGPSAKTLTTVGFYIGNA